MNLHAGVSGIIAAVNPFLTVTVQRSTGYTTNADFTRSPTFTTFTAKAQVQALSSAELAQVDGLNLQGEKIALYINGNLQGVNRPDGAGGDLVTLPDGSTWIVTILLENWNRMAGWSKCALVRQTP